MSRIRHEIIVRDGTPRLRSQIDGPVRKHLDDEAITLNQESGLMDDVEQYLMMLIDAHEEKLVLPAPFRHGDHAHRLRGPLGTFFHPLGKVHQHS